MLRRLNIDIVKVSSPKIIVERAGSYAWTHKSKRAREEFARTVTSAFGLFVSIEFPLQCAILPSILNDINPGVRESATTCIELKDINSRLEKIEPKVRSSDAIGGNHPSNETKLASFNMKKSSPNSKSSTRGLSLFGADGDITEKPVEPIKLYSKEFEKIA